MVGTGDVSFLSSFNLSEMLMVGKFWLGVPDQVNVMDTLSRLSHDTDSEVAMVCPFVACLKFEPFIICLKGILGFCRLPSSPWV